MVLYEDYKLNKTSVNLESVISSIPVMGLSLPELLELV